MTPSDPGKKKNKIPLDNPTLKNVESSKSLLKRLIIGLKNISKNESVYSVKLRKLKKRRKKH